MHQKLVVSDIAYPDWPLETFGISVVSGDPKGTGKVTYQTTDKLVSGGVWGVLSWDVGNHLRMG